MVKRERECNHKEGEKEEGRSEDYKLLGEKGCTVYIGIRA